MAPRETEDNAYAKFWGDKQRALWYVMVFLEWSINLSLETEVVPTEWKMAKVIPIFKSSSMAEIDN